MTQPGNAITRRIGVLSNQWGDFASDGHARVFVWRVAPDEVRMVDAFLASELEDRSAEHSDLFITLEAAFTAPDSYADQLREELVEQYRREQEPLRAEGVAADWSPPERQPRESELALLVRACTSFAAHHELPGRLVLVLRAAEVREPPAYRAWLVQLAGALPQTVRVVTLEDPSAPAWELDAQATQRVRVQPAALDMPGAYAEISQNAGGLETPGGQFREGFLQLAASLSSEDLPRAIQLGDALLALAGAQGWFHMCVPVHSMLASTLAANNRGSEAEAHYLAAEQSALRGQTEGPLDSREMCKKLRLQTRLGLGSTLIAGEKYAEAAQVFEETEPMAADLGEQSIRLDCYRLAAFCHERRDAPEAGFRAAYDGLTAAKQMPAEVLATSSLPFLGETLLRLCEPAKQGALKQDLERDLERLLRPPFANESANQA